MKGNYDEDSERQSRPHGRPVKKVLDADDDEPTYVDAESNAVLSRTEAEELLREEVRPDAPTRGNESTEPPEEGIKDERPESNAAKQQAAGRIGVTGKRKLGKVVGENEAEDEATKSTPKLVKKAAKKAKIKLSFDEE